MTPFYDPIVEVASSDDVGLVEVLGRFGRGLDVQISFFLRGKEVPPQSLPRVSRGKTLQICEDR